MNVRSELKLTGTTSVIQHPCPEYFREPSDRGEGAGSGLIMLGTLLHLPLCGCASNENSLLPYALVVVSRGYLGL